MPQVKDYGEEGARLLSRFGTYLQKSNVAEGADHGFPVDPGIWALVGAAGAIFFKSFLEELGKQAAQTVGALGKKAIGAGDSNSGKELHQQVLILLQSSDPTRLQAYLSSDAPSAARKEYERLLEEKGMPSRRADLVSRELWEMIARSTGRES